MRFDVFNGQCACGCGMTTSTLKHDDPETGRKAGQHRRYAHGHYHRHMRALGKISGEQADRLKLREKRRGELVRAVLNSDGTISLQEIAIEVAPEFRLEGCSMMINSAREWQWWDGSTRYDEIPRLRVKKQIQIRPRYERPFIPNERETEIPLLVNQRRAILLDAPVGDGERSGHEMWGNNSLTPLEILLLKEQQEEEVEREKRIEEWNRWISRRKSAFSNMVQQSIATLNQASGYRE